MKKLQMSTKKYGSKPQEVKKTLKSKAVTKVW